MKLKDYLVGGNHTTSFDTWGSPERSELYAVLKDKDLIEIEGEIYLCIYKAGGGCGMGSYPEKVIVRHIDVGSAEKITL